MSLMKKTLNTAAVALVLGISSHAQAADTDPASTSVPDAAYNDFAVAPASAIAARVDMLIDACITADYAGDKELLASVVDHCITTVYETPDHCITESYPRG